VSIPGSRDGLLRAALSYARRGWPVFPCVAGEKIPATRHGFKDATCDPARIQAWWRAMPAANVAVATGAPAVDVLDVDAKHGASGFASLRRLAAAGLTRGASALIKTPSGGVHLHYVGTAQRNGSLPRHGVDFRGHGGYALLPPSVVDGRPYVLVEHRAATGQLDQDAVRALLDPPRPARRFAERHGGGGADRVRWLASWVARRHPGGRNSALFWASCRAVESGADRAALELLADAGAACGLDPREIRATIGSALRRAGGVPGDR
jgi:hypothetical protein